MLRSVILYTVKYLKNKKYCKVRDHFHYTREYRYKIYHTYYNLLILQDLWQTHY